MKSLIVANWKENPESPKEAEVLFNAIKKGVKSVKAEVVICVPSVYLSLLKGLTLGAQDVSYQEKGAFTGEVSAEMLKDLGVEYVIIGHSERRRNFNETNEVINKKIKASIKSEVEQIFCVGETAEERNSGNQEKVVEKQITEGLKDITDVVGMVVAYEPVWAIGTGNNCTIDDARKMREFIQKVISDIYGKDILKSVRILYGGSVTSGNSAEYLKTAGYNGLLVGGASLNAEEFIKIVRSAE